MSFFLKSKNLLLAAIFLAAIAGGIFGLTIKITQAVTIGAPLGTDQTKAIEEQQAAGAQKAVEKAKIEENQAKINYNTAVKQYGADSTDPEFLKIKTAYEGTQSDVQKTEQAKTAVPETARQTASQKPPNESSGFRLPVVFHVIGGVLYVISWLLSKLIALGAYLAEMVLKINDFAKVAVVQNGWEITRGLANMFFALILLIMAFATTLRLESFGYKKILPRLVLSALLINFSLVFAGMIIDFANVFTNYFIDAITKNGGISDQLMNGLQISRMWEFKSDAGVLDKIATFLAGPSSTMLMEMVVMIIFLIIVAFSFFALALFLIFRIVVIWLLLIFAPLAWVSMIVPGKAGSLWGQWWSIFLKWVFFAPIYCFFLFLGLLMVSQNTVNNELVKSGGKGDSIFLSGFFNDPRTLLQYIVVIIILLGGLIAAQKMGIYGAAGVMKLGKGLTGFGKDIGHLWLGKGAKVPGADYLSRKIGPQKWAEKGWISQGALKTIQAPGAVKRWIAPKLTPQVWSKSLAAIKARADQNAFEEASGDIEDIWESIKKLGGLGAKKTIDGRSPKEKQQELDRLAKEVEQKRINNEPGYEWEKTKELLKQNGIKENTPEAAAFMRQWDMGEAERMYQPVAKQVTVGLLKAVGRMANPDAYYARVKRQSLVAKRQSEASSALKDEDQIVHAYTISKDPIEKEALLRLVASINGINTLFGKLGMAFDPDNVREYIRKEFGDDAGARIAADISAIGANNGNFSLVGMTKWDPRQNKTVFNSPEGQREIAKIKAYEMELQKWSTSVHPDSFFKRDKNGQMTKELHDFGKYWLSSITGGHADWGSRLQGRTLKALHDAAKNIEKMVQEGKIVFENETDATKKIRVLPENQKAIIRKFMEAVESRFRV